MKRKKWLFCFLLMAVLLIGLVLPLSAADYDAMDIALTPGEDASGLNFAWITYDYGSEECAVQIAKKRTGFKRSATFIGTKALADDGVADYYYCDVTVAGLKNWTEYIYRLGDNNGNWSETYQYSTENRNRYGFVYLADPQLGAGDDLETDIAGWDNTLSLIGQYFPEAAFIMSAGDQIENPGNEDQWAGFFLPAELTSIPVAPVAASHDELGTGRGGAPSSEAFDYHFNLPNESEHFEIWADVNNCPPPPPPNCGEPGAPPCPPPGPPCEPDYQWCTLSSGDYYFTYGKALYMVLNMDSKDYEAHEAFMQAAVDANPDVKWKIAMWHYTIYTAASRSPFVDREEMTTIMEDLGVDLVLMGHDHSYCRTYPMFDDVVQEEVFNNKGESVNPAGVVYYTANSASGSKYYDLDPDVDTFHYVAAYSQEYVPTFSYVDVDANSLKITTYRTDTMAEIDAYTIKKVGECQCQHCKNHDSRNRHNGEN